MKDLTPKVNDFKFLARPLIIVGLFVGLAWMAGNSWDDAKEKQRRPAPRPAPVSAPNTPRTRTNSAPRPAPASAVVDPCEGQVVCQRPDGTVQAVVDFLLAEGIRHPHTYRGLSWSELMVSPSTGLWMVKHRYRAENDFGNTVTETNTFTLDIYGQVQHVF
jgi:hypothetical protein